jgi:hypothetical protein
MVRQIILTERVTVAEGWQLGWSGEAWRLFLVGLIINIPLVILSLGLILLALSPLLLIITEELAWIIVGVSLTVLAVIFVILLLVVISAIVTPLLELAWRRTVSLLVSILINSFVTGLYLIFHSAVWTLTYLEIQKRADEPPSPQTPAVNSDSALAPAPL